MTRPKISLHWSWMPAAVFLIGIGSIILFLWVRNISERQRIFALVEDALMDAQINAATSHLWLEEAVSGDATTGQAIADIDQSINLVNVALDGGKSEHGIIPEPMKDPKLRAHAGELRSMLMNFKKLGRERLQHPAESGIATILDQQFDEAFKDILAKAGVLEELIEQAARSERTRSGHLFAGILSAWVFIITAATAGLWRAESRRRNAEERIKEKSAMLEAANKELESFAYSVSHDLRAPLRHIAGFVELLRNKMSDSLDGKGAHYLDVIAGASGRMSALIDDLLSFSRMGRAEMMNTAMDLNRLIDEVINAFSPETAGRRIVWKVDRLPVVKGDPSMLRVAVTNLISNALKFTRSRPEAVIEIGCSSDDRNEAVFFIKDNGVGFDMQYVDKLFSLFQRLHREEEFEGTGVGLASVMRIVGRHGGRTWAEGRVDKGAAFYFSLPKKEG